MNLSENLLNMHESEEAKTFFMSVSYTSASKEERLKIASEFNKLAMKLRKDMKDSKIEVKGPWDNIKKASF